MSQHRASASPKTASRVPYLAMIDGKLCIYCHDLVQWPCKNADDADECPRNQPPPTDDEPGDDSL